MKRIIIVRSFTALLMVFFLGNSIVSCPLNFISIHSGSDSAAVSADKNSSAPSSDNELPFEEKEKEAKDVSEEYQDDLFLIDHATESVLSTVMMKTAGECHTQWLFRYSPAIPLYLAQRTLLI